MMRRQKSWFRRLAMAARLGMLSLQNLPTRSNALYFILQLFSQRRISFPRRPAFRRP